MRSNRTGMAKLPIGIMVVLMMTSLACGFISDLTGSVSVDDIVTEDEVEAPVITGDDMKFPPADFEILFAITPFGSFMAHNRVHTIRWAFHAVSIDTDLVQDFYLEYFPDWPVERDEVINGQRNILYSMNHPLSLVSSQAVFQGIVQDNPGLNQGVLDVEVLRMPEHEGMARLAGLDLEDLPDASIIIVAEYIYQELEETPTPEPVEETPAAGDLQSTCQQAISSSLCANPYFPPIEGLTLVYEIDGRRTQTRHIGPVQRGVEAPGEPPMDAFTVTFVDDQFTMEMDFFCTEEGVTGGDIGKALASALEGQEIEGETISFEEFTYEFDGVAMPNDISPGDTWEAYVEIVMSSGGLDLVTTNDARYLFEGYTTVTTPAGAFESRKIITDMDVDVTAHFPAAPHGPLPIASVQLTSVAYYAECIGMVMSEGDVSLRLVDYILP